MEETVLLKKFEPLAHKLALKYAGMVEYDDLFQNARLGILEAIRSYDKNAGATLFTHAYNRAFFAIQHCLKKNSNFIQQDDVVQQININSKDFDLDNETEDLADISKKLAYSFEQKLDNSIVLNSLVNQLTKPEQTVIEYLIYNQYSLRETGKIMNLSAERVRQISKQALDKLSTMLTEEHLSQSELSV